MKEKEKEKTKCSECMGYGWWPYGGLSPLGPMDGGEMRDIAIQCPVCLAGSVKEGKRYKLLKLLTKALKGAQKKK
jgi:hypothetical protein